MENDLERTQADKNGRGQLCNTGIRTRQTGDQRMLHQRQDGLHGRGDPQAVAMGQDRGGDYNHKAGAGKGGCLGKEMLHLKSGELGQITHECFKEALAG